MSSASDDDDREIRLGDDVDDDSDDADDNDDDDDDEEEEEEEEGDEFFSEEDESGSEDGVNDLDDADGDDAASPDHAARVAAILAKPLKNADRPILAAVKKPEVVDGSAVDSALALNRQRRDKRLEKRLYLNRHHDAEPEYTAKERTLLRIATRGVVTLFNAVESQQRKVAQAEAVSDSKTKQKLLAQPELSKAGFLDLLKSTEATQAVKAKAQEAGAEAARALQPAGAASNPAWSVLQDTFMMGQANMREWDDGVDDGLSPDEEAEDDDAAAAGEADGKAAKKGGAAATKKRKGRGAIPRKKAGGSKAKKQRRK